MGVILLLAVIIDARAPARPPTALLLVLPAALAVVLVELAQVALEPVRVAGELADQLVGVALVVVVLRRPAGPELGPDPRLDAEGGLLGAVAVLARLVVLVALGRVLQLVGEDDGSHLDG